MKGVTTPLMVAYIRRAIGVQTLTKMIRSIFRRCHSRSAKSRKRALVLLACSISAASQAAGPHYFAWGQLYEDTQLQSQVPHALALDSRGNVFVTGQADSGNGQTFYTAKYDGLDGHKIWERTVSVSGTNQYIANAIVNDSEGDSIVTGSRNNAATID